MITSLPIELAANARNSSAALGVLSTFGTSALCTLVRSFLISCLVLLSTICSAMDRSECAANAEGSEAYVLAANTVREMPEFQSWSKSHSYPIAFGTFADKEVAILGKCYWSVSVYANLPERFELWNVFFVRLPNDVAFVQKQVSGNPVSTGDWRIQNATEKQTKQE